jgi:hypothetical protein
MTSEGDLGSTSASTQPLKSAHDPTLTLKNNEEGRIHNSASTTSYGRTSAASNLDDFELQYERKKVTIVPKIRRGM